MDRSPGIQIRSIHCVFVFRSNCSIIGALHPECPLACPKNQKGNGMKKILFILLIILLFNSISTGIQEEGPSRSASSYLETFLPDKNQIPGFMAQDSFGSFKRDNLSEYLGADETGLFIPSGFIELLTVTFGNENNEKAFVLEIYRFFDERGAFGIYAAFRKPEGADAPYGTGGFRDEEGIDFWKGSYFVRVLFKDTGNAVLQGAETCAGAVAEKIPPEFGKPLEFRDFPAEGAVPVLDRYIPIRYLSTDFLFEVYTREYGEYPRDWQAFQTLVPTLEESIEVFSKFKAFLETGHEVTEKKIKGADEAWEGVLDASGPPRITIFRKGRRIAGVVGAYPGNFLEQFTFLLPREQKAEFSIFLEEEKVGQEIYYLDKNSEGKAERSASYSFLSIEGNFLALDQILRNKNGSGLLEEYRLTVVENNRRTIFGVHSTKDGLVNTSSDGFNRYEQKHAMSGDLVVLDNLIAHHYQFLLDRYDFKKRGKQTFTALVPQSFARVPLEMTWEGETEGMKNGQTIQVDKLRVSSPNLLIDIWADKNHNLVQIIVPAQAYRFSRDEISLKEDEVPQPAYLEGHHIEEETISFPSGEIFLKGTMTYPAGNQEELPGVILVGGSGPLDRDETIGPNKPFRDLAIGLASRGIVVMRYDKKSFSFPGSVDPFSITLQEDIMDDAVAALRYLKGRGDVAGDKIFLLGHSLGATAVSFLPGQENVTGGLILLTPHARSLDHLVLDQTAFILKNSGTSEDDIAKESKRTEEGFQKIREGTFPEKTLFHGIGPAYWEDILKRNLPEKITNIDLPLLLLYGAKDYQVTELEYRLFKEALEGKKEVEGRLLLYPDLNHYFMKIEGAPSPRDYGLKGYVAEEVIEDISTFIHSVKK